MKVEHRKGATSWSQSHKRYDTSHRIVMSQSQSQCMTGSHMMGNMRTVEGKVYSHNGSCIYSVENQIGTLLSSPCQLRLRVDLSCPN